MYVRKKLPEYDLRKIKTFRSFDGLYVRKKLPEYDLRKIKTFRSFDGLYVRKKNSLNMI